MDGPLARLPRGGRPAPPTTGPTKPLPAPVADGVPSPEVIPIGDGAAAAETWELRAALTLVQASGARLQNPAVLASPGRRAGRGQIDALLGQLDTLARSVTGT